MAGTAVVGLRVQRKEYELINALADLRAVTVSELLREIVMPAVNARATAAVTQLGSGHSIGIPRGAE